MNRAVPDVFLAGGDQVPRGHTRRCLSAVESREQLEEEEAGEIKEGNGSHAVPLRRSGAFRAHGRNYDVFKRHSWGPGRELEDPLTRRRLRASGCPGPKEAPYLQNQEELDTFLGLQHQGGYPSRLDHSEFLFLLDSVLGQDSCHPSAGPLDHSATGMLSKSVSMSGINCLLDWSDPDGEQKPRPLSLLPTARPQEWRQMHLQLGNLIQVKRVGEEALGAFVWL
ncbi:uncharacterized protein [Chlorocebus sabaeus]|uniref:uncharacterized protein n=1 Tax=Chlorocebus sabaeus TaxID=60711 RepID=UPI003BF95F2D